MAAIFFSIRYVLELLDDNQIDPQRLTGKLKPGYEFAEFFQCELLIFFYAL
jgi:hypothetical protein